MTISIDTIGAETVAKVDLTPARPIDLQQSRGLQESHSPSSDRRGPQRALLTPSVMRPEVTLVAAVTPYKLPQDAPRVQIDPTNVAQSVAAIKDLGHKALTDPALQGRPVYAFAHVMEQIGALEKAGDKSAPELRKAVAASLLDKDGSYNTLAGQIGRKSFNDEQRLALFSMTYGASPEAAKVFDVAKEIKSTIDAKYNKAYFLNAPGVKKDFADALAPVLNKTDAEIFRAACSFLQLDPVYVGDKGRIEPSFTKYVLGKLADGGLLVNGESLKKLIPPPGIGK